MWTIASAASPGAEPLPPATVAQVAEYERLSQELESLAVKNAWAGVERMFKELLATGVAPSAADWLRGAEAARSIGDIGSAYVRIREARKLEPDNRMIVEWLYDIDHRYGTVDLACDLGSQIQLRREEIPFDPEAQRAIRFAQTQIRERCEFHGRLPAGEYRFYLTTFLVEPQVSSSKVELRELEIPKSIRRYLKAEWEKTLAEETQQEP